MAEHPIPPPPELVQQWRNAAPALGVIREVWISTEAAQWGADQELEACCELVSDTLYLPTTAHELRAARRPKPPSLKEQALTALHAIAAGANDTREQHQDLETLRHAIEALPND
jgi:hypothetical protein